MSKLPNGVYVAVWLELSALFWASATWLIWGWRTGAALWLIINAALFLLAAGGLVMEDDDEEEHSSASPAGSSPGPEENPGSDRASVPEKRSP